MANEPANNAETAKKPAAGGMNKKATFIFVGIGLAVIILSAGTATFMHSALAGSGTTGNKGGDSKHDGGEAKGGHGEKAEGKGDAAEPADAEYAYIDFEPIIVNLNEPRLARYARVTIGLAIKKDKDDVKVAKTAIEAHKKELKNWLNLYLAGLTLEDVRGSTNLNRIRRQIEDAFNEQLFRDGKPLIHHVLLELVVQ